MASPAMNPDGPPERDDLSSGTAESMVGGDSSSSPMPDPQSQARGFISQVKEFSTGIESLAKQFPAGANEFKKAQDSLKDAMSKVISEMQKQGGRQKAPPVG